MRKTLIAATGLVFALSGAAFAQTPAGGGRSEGNVNNPASVKSNSEKSMERGNMPATTGTAPGASTGGMTKDGADTGGMAKKDGMMKK